jgi:hypothetical protein
MEKDRRIVKTYDRQRSKEKLTQLAERAKISSKRRRRGDIKSYLVDMVTFLREEDTGGLKERI